MRLASIILFVAVATACGGSLAPDDHLPGKDVAIVLDSAVYHLQPTTYGWYVNVAVSVVNQSDQDIYLSQSCGYWGVSRPDYFDPYLELGAYDCAAGGSYTRPAPRLIAAGDRYTQTFKLHGDIQLQARPQVLIENNIGPMIFRYMFTDPLATKGVNLRSTTFEVLPAQ